MNRTFTFTAKQIIAGFVLSLVVGTIVNVAFSMSARAAENGLGCYVGGSVGATVSATKLSSGDASATLGSSAPMASPEVGCKLTVSQLVTAGVLGRFDWMNASTKLSFSEASAAIKQNGRWMLAATLGVMVNPSTEAYALAGFSGSTFKLGTESETFNSYVVGAGLNLDIGKGPLSLFVEGNAFIGKPKTFEDAKIAPRDYALRTGLRFKF